MAVRVSKTSGSNFAGANSFYNAESYNLYPSAGTSLTLPQRPGVTFANAGNLQGLLIGLRTEANTADTTFKSITVKLQQIMGTCTVSAATDEVTFTSHGFSDGQAVVVNAATTQPGGITANTVYYARATGTSAPTNTFNLYDTQAHAIAGGATGKVDITSTGTGTLTLYADRASETKSGTDICGTTSFANGDYFIPFEFSSPYAVDTTASKWRFDISASGAQANTHTLCTSDNTNFFHTAWCDNTGTLSANDALVVTHTTTVNSTITLKGVVGTGQTTNAVAILIASHPNPTPTNVAYLVWENTPTSSYTLTIDGLVMCGVHSGLRAGTSGSKIPIAQKGAIYFPTPTVAGNGFITSRRGSATLYSSASLFVYAESPANRVTTLAADVAFNSAVITTINDMSATWQAGDILAIGGEKAQGARPNGAAGLKTISSISGTSITLTGNISDAFGFAAGAPVYNLSRPTGFKISAQTAITQAFYGPNNLVLDGVEVVNYGFSSSFLSNGGVAEFADSYCSQYQIKNCTFRGQNVFAYLPVPKAGFLLDSNCFGPGGVLAASAITGFTGTSGSSGTLEVTNNYFIGSGMTRGDGASQSVPVTFTGNKVYNINDSAIVICGSDAVFSNNSIWGISARTGSGWGAVTFSRSLNATGSGNTYDYVSHVYGFVDPSFNTSLSNEVYSATTVSNLVTPNSGAYFSCRLTNVTNLPTSITTALMQRGVPGTVLELITPGGTAADYRSYNPYGFAYTPSGGGKMYMQSFQSLYNYPVEFEMLAGAVSGAKAYFSINCKVANAAYYAGTHSAPAMIIAHDNTTTTVSATDSTTTQQALTSTFTFSTNSQPLSLTLLTYTDATGTNADVYWDTLLVNVRKYGKVFQSYSSTIERFRDDVIVSVADLSNNPHITETTEATVAAYSGISINHATQTCTITANHTIQELYDYAQYDLTQSSNLAYAEWLTTVDDTTYSSDYDIIVDGCTLTATGKILDLGSNDFQLTNGGAVVASRVTDVDGTAVTLLLDGVLSGSVYEIYKTSDGTSYGSGTASGDVAISFNHTSDVDITWVVRKFGYLEARGTGTITVNGFTANVQQVADPNTASYPGGISSDFTINTSTSTITHTSGTTVYTSRQLYNWTMDYFANASRLQKLLPLSAQTPFDFTLQNSYTMDDTTHEYLKSGSITEDSGNTLWANVYTVGSIASGNIYIYQNGSEYTKFWGDGNIDVLLKVKTGGSLIDSGYVTLFTREYGYKYDHYKADLSNGGRTAVSVTSTADPNNPTAEATIAGWTDIVVTTGGGPYSHDIGDGLGAANYTTEVDAGGHAIKDVYERLKYLAEEGQSGEAYTRADASFSEVKEAPYGTFAGGVFFGAQGIWVDNVATDDALNYILTDNAGTTHQVPSPPVQLSGTSIVNGSRIQVYDEDDDVELVNEVVSGTSHNYEYDYGTIGGHTLRVRLTYASGTTYKKEWSTRVIAGSSGASYIAAQEDWDAVNAWGLDGSSITEFSADYPNVQIDADDMDGETTKTRLGAWWAYNLTTEDGIANFFGGIEVPASNVIKVITSVVDLQIQNVSSTSLVFTDSDVRLYRDNGTPIVAAGTGSIEIDYSGVPDVVETGVSGLTSAESEQLFAIPTDGALTAEQAAQLKAASKVKLLL